ncbi:hypothetical protein SNEBB_002167, partial [Seison nebaliae]
MVRNYVRKTEKLSEQKISSLIDESETTGVSLNKLAKRHGISKSTLYYRKSRPSRPRIFDEEEEKRFVAYIQFMADHSMPLTLSDVSEVVGQYLSKANRIVPIFNNNKPGKEWCLSFIKRHEIERKLCQNISLARAEVDWPL